MARYDISQHARAGGKARMERLDVDAQRTLASQAGKARMRRLDRKGRRDLARLGLAGLANRYFDGDQAAAADWLARKGRHIQDPGRGTAWELDPDPGPLPTPSQYAGVD